MASIGLTVEPERTTCDAAAMVDLRAFLLAQPILGRMSPASVDALVTGGRPEAFAAGTVLLQEGERSDCAVLILEGRREQQERAGDRERSGGHTQAPSSCSARATPRRCGPQPRG